jgi:hypothetical protein
MQMALAVVGNGRRRYGRDRRHTDDYVPFAHLENDMMRSEWSD